MKPGNQRGWAVRNESGVSIRKPAVFERFDRAKDVIFMKLSTLTSIRGEEWNRYKDEINKENRIAIHLLGIAGLPLSLMNAAAQYATSGFGMALVCSLFMSMYFLLFMLAENFLLPLDYPLSTRLLYILESPVMVMAILLGTVLDPGRQAITVLLFLVALPVFIMDRPGRLTLFSGGWVALFLALCVIFKDQSLWATDAVHILEFYFTTVALVNVILRIRMESLRHLMEGEYHLAHEQRTGCLNRYALASRAGAYAGQRVTVLLADMDRFMLYNDFYGHETGLKIMDFFTGVLMSAFGGEDTYHYNGDEFLCVVHGGPEDCKEKIAQCRKALNDFTLEDRKLSLTCAFGCAVGTPASTKEFQEMVQLADINTHKAKKTGANADLCTEYNQANLRAAIAQSNMLTHANASEIDQLTGLPGMSYFVSRSDALISSGMVYKNRGPVVGCFKLVQMRDFNDAFGYTQGNALIAETARLLQRHFKNRYICHITGAQFGILCYEGEVEDAMSKINASLRDYHPGFPVSGSAGFARYEEGVSVISLLDRARVAQGTLSADGKPAFCYYDQKIDDELRFRQYVISHVDEAIEKGWLQVYYQPIARTITGHVCNEEALSRWDDPQYGFLMPARFIHTLEENGLMYKVNLNVVSQVLKDFRRRQELGVPIVPVSVNLSRRDFEKCDMVYEIMKRVDESGFPRSLLKIEITESAFIENQELLKREVARFRNGGFDVWMDDFGSEYSTLNLLQELDFDLIKIDMQFMKNFSTSGKNYIIISDIIDMARRMGIATLIEGVETWEHFQVLQALGCEKIQGYLFNRPNSFDYIVDRAQRKAGLTFEDPEAAPYYEPVGRIDLNEPLAHSGDMAEAWADSEVPAGVLELREGRLNCLRGNARFMQMLKNFGALPADDEEQPRIRLLNDNPPKQFLTAVMRCAETEGWINYSVSTEEEGPLNIYLRQVSTARYRGGTAILVVALHG